MQFNFLHLEITAGETDKKRDRKAFVRPGFETTVSRGIGERGEKLPPGSSHTSHDIAFLIDWDLINRCGQIDARLRHDTSHALAQCDNLAITFSLQSLRHPYMNCESNQWMNKSTYTNTPLRDHQESGTILRKDGEYFKLAYFKDRSGRSQKYVPWPAHRLQVIDDFSADHVWNLYSEDEIAQEAKDHGISEEKAFEGTYTFYKSSGENEDQRILVDDLAFGFYLQKRFTK